MFTLSRQCRAALLFFLPGTLLVALFTLAKPGSPVYPAVSELKPDDSRMIDYTPLQNSWHSWWLRTLKSEGITSDSITSEAITSERVTSVAVTGILHEDSYFHLNERRYGRLRLKWADFTISLVLPINQVTPTSEKTLVKLGSAWQSLLAAYNPGPTTIRWGYGGGGLWLRMTAAVRPSAVRGVRLNLAQITLIQPVASSNRWLGLQPRKPPSLCPVLLPVSPESTKMKGKFQSPPDAFVLGNEVSPRKGATPRNEVPPRSVWTNPKAAIIIDDVGYVQTAATELLKIPAPLTWAILPKTPFAQTDLNAARACGFEIILHLPLEPLDSSVDPGPGLIRKEWDAGRIRKQLAEDLASVPGAVGINNHMGSAGTKDDRLMRVLMSVFHRRNLFFVDSMTVADSVAEKYARRYRVPFAKRQVFIDNQANLESQKTALRNLLQIALTEGSAVGIAHARPGTAAAIREMLPEFDAAGVELVPVSELVRTEESRS